MSDYSEHEILTTYAEQTEKQIIDLNRTIVALRTRVAMLEKELEERNRIPVPRTVVEQIVDMEQKKSLCLMKVLYQIHIKIMEKVN